MEKESKNIWESDKRVIFAPPAVELFSDPAGAGEAWPELAGNEQFLNQLESRKKLNENLDAVFASLPRPDISLEQAAAENLLTEDQIGDLYSSLVPLIEDKDYERIILYLPFEFLPSANWTPVSEEIKQQAERFRSVYMTAWNNLLTVHDVRANFLDGDVLEVESRVEDLPRVVKAAHLIPKLVEKGFMKTEDVFQLLESSDDEVLRRSVAETLPVLFDMGFIQEGELAQLKASDDLLVREKMETMSAGKLEDEVKIKGVNQPEIARYLSDECSDIDREVYENITEKRKAWLKQDKKQKVIEAVGDAIKAAISGGALTEKAATEFFSSEADPLSQQAFIDGVRKAIEAAIDTDRPRAQNFYNQYRERFLALWENKAPEIRPVLAKTFCRLRGLGMVTDEELENLGLTIPKLAGPFSENLDVMGKEMTEIANVAASIESNPEVSKYFYPAVLVFGSRLKGYGGENADLDAAVFVRPGARTEDLEKLKAMLKEVFESQKIHRETVQFWLEETERSLGVKDLSAPEISIGSGYWAHVLFGAAWEGDPVAINELREKLLLPYFYNENKKIFDRDARGLYIEELERDTLQYRLMHKGYENYFPSYGGVKTPHADQIDGRSAFWDSGYRQVATKLFASRVFLPKISR